MLLFGLQLTTTRQFQTTKSVGGALSKSKEMAVQTIPKEASDQGHDLHRAHDSSPTAH